MPHHTGFRDDDVRPREWQNLPKDVPVGTYPEPTPAEGLGARQLHHASSLKSLCFRWHVCRHSVASVVCV